MPRPLRLLLLALLLWAAPLQAARILLCGESYMEPVAAALDRVGLPYERLPEASLADRDPRQAGALFLAHEARVDAAVLSWIDAFLSSGGKLFTFFSLPPSLQERLGVRQGEYLRPAQPLAQIRTLGKVPHLPAAVRQNSWNIDLAAPAGDSVQVIATWFDQQGRDTGYPALLLSPRGAHLTHVLLDHDPEGACRLYVGLLGHFFPQVWPQAVRGALARAAQVGDSSAVSSRLGQQALARLARGEYTAALDAAFQARDQAVQALARAQVSRPGEFRGVWLHSPYGVDDWGWDRTCRQLAAAGFNAIVANMLDAGRSSYPSAVLPIDPRVAERGDQLQQAVTAAHRYGLAFHAWKVNYNLYSADSSFVASLRQQGRLQQDDQGKEVLWLCPSHPDNFALELASLLEVVRNYPVDGIHFDYIRYPDSQACYCDGCRTRFQAQTGHQVSSWPEDVITGELAEPFQQWRREQITRLVRAASVQVRRVRPEVQVSAAVFGDWPQTRISIGQDWVAWLDEGYLDFVCPMDYIPPMDDFRRTVERQVGWVRGRAPLYIGIGAFLLPAAEDIIRQIAWTRQAGADGFILFQYDPRLGEQVLPLLAQGMTRQKTCAPHLGPAISFATSGDLKKGWEPGDEFCADTGPVHLEVQLTEGIQARQVQARLGLRTLADTPMQDLGLLRAGRDARLSAYLPLASGDYRPVVEGRYRDPAGQERAFTRRGPLLRVRGQAFLDSLDRLGVPQVPGPGVPVGVLLDGYGGQALLRVLQSRKGLAAFPVHYLTPAVLAAARVLVLPQPRQRSHFDQEQILTLRQWVAQGGRLLVTHDLAGLRGLQPVVPEVCRRGAGFPRSTQWQIVGRHPAVASIPPGLQPHSYYDHVVLEPGPEGTVLAADEAGRPVLVVGPHGQGRYAALGLVPGLGPDDEEVAPQAAERQLVESLVQWLAEGL